MFEDFGEDINYSFLTIIGVGLCACLFDRILLWSFRALKAWINEGRVELVGRIIDRRLFSGMFYNPFSLSLVAPVLDPKSWEIGTIYKFMHAK